MAEENVGTVTIPRQTLAALSHELGRAKFLQKAGMQYSGKRDIYAVAGYPQELKFEDYWKLYRRGDIAGRLVDMQPQTTWRTPPELVQEDMDPENPPEFIEQFSSLAQRLKLWSRFERVDRLAGVGRYAILLLGVRGEDAELKNEMPRLTNGPDDLLYVSVFHEGSAEIKSFITDTEDPRFGEPEIYEVDLSSGIANMQAQKRQVHASRIIHVAEDRLEDEVFGTPRLQRAWNRLMDLEKICAATGEAYWQLASRILAGKVDPTAELPDGAGDKMVEQLEEMVHDLRRVFMGQGTELEWLESVPPDPEGASDLALKLIAASRGIPMRMLIGNETGERSSTEDQKTYLGTIEERIERFAEPDILRAFIDRLVEYGGLTDPGEEGYQLVWPSLAVESEKDLAEANKARAETAKALTPIGGDPLEIVEVDEHRNVWLRPTVAPEDPEAATPRPVPEGEEDDEDETPEPPAFPPPPVREEEEEEPPPAGNVAAPTTLWDRFRAFMTQEVG